jgi:hypothetical protein
LRRRSFYIISDPVPPGNESGGQHECGCCSAAGTVPRPSNRSWRPADPGPTFADAGPPAARQGALCRDPLLLARQAVNSSRGQYCPTQRGGGTGNTPVRVGPRPGSRVVRCTCGRGVSRPSVRPCLMSGGPTRPDVARGVRVELEERESVWRGARGRPVESDPVADLPGRP